MAHTWQVWSAVVPALATTHTVIAPDLRGLGASEHVTGPYDAGTVAGDLHALLDRLDGPDAAVMALDASVPAAFLLGMRHPERLRALVLMESLLMYCPARSRSSRPARRGGSGSTPSPGSPRRCCAVPAPRRSPR